MRIKGTTINTKPKASVRYCVGDYLTEMNKAYTEKYRVIFEELTARRERENERWKAEIRRGWSNNIQRNMHEQEHKKTINELTEAINRLQIEAKADFDEILAEADERFEKHSRPTGDKIDLATVELLKSGILSDDDFPRLAKDFNGNVAMTRIIGKYAKERAEQSQIGEVKSKLNKLVFECEQDRFNYREPLAEFASLCEMALSDDSCKTQYEIRANAYHRVLTEGYSDRYDTVKDLSISEEYTGANKDGD